jgi:hypothetical protein
MNRTVPLAVVLALSMLAAGRPASASPPAAVVGEWNQILQDTLPPSEGVQTPRYYAMMHIAMFDAVNALEREFEPYRVTFRLVGCGSPEAAAAQAAHDVLVALNPSKTAIYDAVLAQDIGTSPPGFVRRGAAIGASVAKQVLAWRQSDRWVVPAFPPYSEPLLPGRWDPGWLPLLPTPPYPSYAGNLATIGASAARALQLAFGTNDIPVTITWRQAGGLGEVAHHLPGFWQAAEE